MQNLQLPFIYFVPDYSLFDDVEMAPCQVIGSAPDCNVERIDEPKDHHKIAFWSVYMHYKTGGVDCVADFETKAEAEELYEQLKQHLEIFCSRQGTIQLGDKQ